MTRADELEGLVRLLNALAVDHECDDEADAADTCSRAADALASLRAERDELVFLLNEGGTWEQQLSAIERERDALAALLKEAREVVGYCARASVDTSGTALVTERDARTIRAIARAFLDKTGDR